MLIPDDIKSGADLIAKWPLVEKSEMAADAAEHPPFGTYTTIDETVWAERGWMMFASSGSTGVPRVFRYSHVDRAMGAWANARALHSMDFRHGDTVFMVTGYGPHVWAWGVQYALEKNAAAGHPRRWHRRACPREHCTALQADNPPTHTFLRPAPRPHHAKHGWQPTGKLRADAVRGRRARDERCRHARAHPGLMGCAHGRVLRLHRGHVGGFSCPASQPPEGQVTTHLMEDVQIWEIIDAESKAPLPDGKRGLTVCTNLNSEASPQLRFLVGDYTTLSRARCACAASRCSRSRSRRQCAPSRVPGTSSRSC
jgi:phenylacetate-CoA ligase